MITFIGGIMESASIQAAKNYRRADVNRAMESVFAEYQKDLWEQYGLFALDGSYESGNYSEKLVTDRLAFYGASNMENTISRIQFLTDDGAEVFYQQVMTYMQDLYGVDFLTDLVGETDSWRQQEEDADKYEDQTEEAAHELNDLLEENETTLPEEDNPISHIEGLKKTPILELVMPKDMEASDKSLDLSGTVSHRELNQGYGDFSDQKEGTMTLSSLLFGQYVLEHFSSAAESKDTAKGGALDYEIEYLIAGREGDMENLKSVVNRLLGIRTGANMLYLETCSAKRDAVRSMANTLCVAVPVPAAGEIAAQLILLAWAYGESLVDIRSLLKGNRVPLAKSDDSWQLSLSGLLKLGEGEDMNDGADDAHGLTYQEYLRMLLFATDRETLAKRTLDLIEINLQTEHGLTFFQADKCITKLEIKSRCSFRRGVTYEFPTYFGYL